MRIKVFRFRISNKVSSGLTDDSKTNWYNAEVMQLSSSEDITDVLDAFSIGKDIKHINVTPITCKQNIDRDREDIVDILYTIAWEEQDYIQTKEDYISFDKKLIDNLKSKIKKEDNHMNIYNQNVNQAIWQNKK